MRILIDRKGNNPIWCFKKVLTIIEEILSDFYGQRNEINLSDRDRAVFAFGEVQLGKNSNITIHFYLNAPADFIEILIEYLFEVPEFENINIIETTNTDHKVTA